MKKPLLLLAFFSALATTFLAQTDNTAPVVWERYRHLDLNVSVLLPKMPTVTAGYDWCGQELKKSSFAYAEGAVYEFTVVAAISKGDRPRYCPKATAPFDQSTIDERLNQLRQAKGGTLETKTRVGDIDAYLFKGERYVRLLVPNVVNKWWIELAVIRSPKDAPDTDRFFQSLQFGDVGAKEIGDGAERTLGDPVSDSTVLEVQVPNPKTDPSKTDALSSPPVSGYGSGSGSHDGQTVTSPVDKDRVVTPLYIASKPQARYTEVARKKGEQGTVRLKVTLLSNGAVGTVRPVTELRYGLTEEAMAAARRLVFLPARVNGVAVSKLITIDYSFAVY